MTVPTADTIDVPATEPIDSRLVLRRMATVAWLSILLGLAIQTALLVTNLLASGQLPPAAAVVVDFAQGLTWSFFVCAGIGLGTTLARSRVALGGLVGMIAAPVAVGVAKGSQKAVSAALDVAERQALLPLMSVSLVRAVQYGILGWLLASLAVKREERLSRYLMAGAVAGLAFGGAITALLIYRAGLAGTPMTGGRIVATSINEMLFPIGCTLVVYVALRVSVHVKQLTA